MQKLKVQNNSFYITSSKAFMPYPPFKRSTIDMVFEFAYAMTFEDGEHRDHRTGGMMSRKKGQIFINTFQGKLSELGVYNTFAKHNKKAYEKLSKPDFDVYGLGEWDDSDIELCDIKISVKSTKFYGNLLLLETKDWSAKGEYLPNLHTDKNAIYDYFVLVRIKPDGEKLMSSNGLLYKNHIDKQQLYTLISSQQWYYDIAGYITNEDLKSMINDKFILPQKSLLNGKIPMDASNYYIQSGDMRDFKKLVKSL